MKISSKGLKALIGFEGFRSLAYQDIVGVWTIGYGFTGNVKPGDFMSRAQADSRLGRELQSYEDAVWSAVLRSATQNQFDALVSFAWNVGRAGMAGSTTIKAHNRGDHQAAARALGLWNKAGGKAVAGLARRRAAEAAMYLTPDEGEDEMPSQVDPESKMRASPINISNTVAAGTASVVAATQTVTVVKDFKESLFGFGEWLVPLLCLVVVASAAYAVYQRFKQRQGGWA